MKRLTPCKTCGYEVAPSARVCPVYGVEKPGVTWWVHKLIADAVVAFILVMGFQRCV